MKQIPNPPDPHLERFSRELDWNLLRTFVAIVQENSISRAASRLGLAQPSVTQALKRLERQLGKRLVDRGHGVFRITQTGETLYRECAQIYGSISRLGVLISEVEDRVRGHVALAAASHVQTPILDTALATFARRYPEVTFSIDVLTSTEVAQAVLQKRASVGLALVRHTVAELNYRWVYRERFGFYCGPPHPLFGQPNVSLADLVGLPTVSFRTDMVDDVLRPVALWRARAELETRIVASSNNLEEVRRLVMAGIGIAPLPIHVMQPDVEAGRLWRLPPHDGDNPPTVSVHRVIHPTAHLSQAEQLFITHLDEAIEAVPEARRHY